MQRTMAKLMLGAHLFWGQRTLPRATTAEVAGRPRPSWLVEDARPRSPWVIEARDGTIGYVYQTGDAADAEAAMVSEGASGYHLAEPSRTRNLRRRWVRRNRRLPLRRIAPDTRGPSHRIRRRPGRRPTQPDS
jgi:hypothetical protein